MACHDFKIPQISCFIVGIGIKFSVPCNYPHCTIIEYETRIRHQLDERRQELPIIVCYVDKMNIVFNFDNFKYKKYSHGTGKKKPS